MEALHIPSQSLYDELMKRAQQNRELMEMLKIGDDAWNITKIYEKALKAMKGNSRPRALYSNKSK